MNRSLTAVIGLGNPGAAYAGTRHNAGHEVLDAIAREFLCENFSENKKINSAVGKTSDYLFAKTLTYMNLSGQAVRSLVDYYQLETSQVYIIHDDLDLELGTYKIQFGKGPELHNGLLSIYQHLGTKNFWHVRVGVDNRQGSRAMEPSDYVLQHFSTEERAAFDIALRKLVEELVVHLKTHHQAPAV